MGLHIFRHIKADEGFRAAEQGLGQTAAQLGLAHAAGTQQQKASHRPPWVFQPQPSPAYRPSHRLYRLLLAQHRALQGLFQFLQSLSVVLSGVAHRYAGPLGQHRSDVALLNSFLRMSLPPALFPRLQFLAEVPLRIPEHGRLFKILLADGLGELTPRLDRPLFQPLQLRGQRMAGQPGLGGRLVHEVDGLVRQKPLGQIANGQIHRRLQGLVRDGDVVVGLIPPPQSPENGQCLVPGGLAHRDGLEAALQGGVLFDIFAVLIQGGGSDDLYLTPGQGRLQDVGCVNGSLRAACPHDGVQLIDEQNHIARPAHLLEHVFELLLKLASVLGACHHGGQVQGTHPFTQQMGRCSAVGNGQSQSLYHRGFAHAWLSDESGVVFRAAGEDLDEPLQLRLPADHRVQLTLAGHGGKVPGTLVQLTGVSPAALGLPAAHDPGDAILASQGGGQALTEPGTVHPALPQQPYG